MAPNKKSVPTPGEELAAYIGFVARLHDHLRLSGTDNPSKFEACRKWLSAEVAAKIPVPESEKAPWE